MLESMLGCVTDITLQSGKVIHGEVKRFDQGYLVANYYFEDEMLAMDDYGNLSVKPDVPLVEAVQELERLAIEAKHYDYGLERWLDWMEGERCNTRVGVTACLQVLKHIAI